MLAVSGRQFTLLALAIRGDRATSVLSVLACFAKAALVLNWAVERAGAVPFVKDTSIFAV